MLNSIYIRSILGGQYAFWVVLVQKIKIFCLGILTGKHCLKQNFNALQNMDVDIWEVGTSNQYFI